MAKLFRYFKEQEFACKCGCGKTPFKSNFGFSVDTALISKLDDLRHRFSKKIVVTSGFRCYDYNIKQSKASLTSSHVKGLAVDITFANFDINRLEVLALVCEMGFKRVGIGKDFIHLDVDIDKSQLSWTY